MVDLTEFLSFLERERERGGRRERRREDNDGALYKGEV